MRNERGRSVVGGLLRGIPDQHELTSLQRRRAAGDDSAFRANSETVRQDQPRALFLAFTAALLQAGFQPLLELGTACHSSQAFPAREHGPGSTQVERSTGSSGMLPSVARRVRN